MTDTLVRMLRKYALDWRDRAASAAEVHEAIAEIDRLTRERDELRKYCSAAAHDYADVLKSMQGCIVPSLADAFQVLAAELTKSSEFMRLASEGRANGLIYEDELSKAKTRALAAESSLSEAVKAAYEDAAKIAERDCRSGLAKDYGYEPTWFKHGKIIASAIRSRAAVLE